MAFLGQLHDDIAAAMSRIYRRLARWSWHRFIDALNLFRVVIIFVPLIYLAGGGYELTYTHAWIPRAFGWFIVVLSVGIMLWAIVELFFNKSVEEVPESTFVWPACLLLSVAFIGFIVSIHHEFKSPILFVTQKLPSNIASALRKAARMGDVATSESSPESGPPYGLSQQVTSVPAPAWDQDVHLSLWVETVHSTYSETFVEVACKTWSDAESATLVSANGAYLVDQNGYKYDIRRDLGEYSFFLGHRTIVGSEIYRWSLVFPLISKNVTALKLMHPQFTNVAISFLSTPSSPTTLR